MGYAWPTVHTPDQFRRRVAVGATARGGFRVDVDGLVAHAIATARVAQELNESHPGHAEMLRAVAADLMTWAGQ